MPLYVPILKGKEGEYGALEELTTLAKDAIQPLIEIPRVPYDYANERPARTLEAHLEGVAQRLDRCWRGRELYLDLPWFGQEERLEDGTVAMARVLSDCADTKVSAIPVISRSSSSQCLAAVRHQLPTSDGKFCIRLSEADFDEDGEADPARTVEALLNAIGTEAGNGDLVLDIGDVGPEIGRATLVARSILAEAPRLQEWRRVVLAAASFPEDLSEVSAATTTRLPRLEWQLWDRLHRRRNDRRPDLLFGDYGIAHPVPTELDPRTMRMSASIRYTTPDHWLIVKGRNVRQYGFDQYFELASELVGLSDYSGEDFSWGDLFITRCARKQVGPGNATTWRKVGTNHHLTLVAQQLRANAGPAV